MKYSLIYLVAHPIFDLAVYLYLARLVVTVVSLQNGPTRDPTHFVVPLYQGIGARKKVVMEVSVSVSVERVSRQQPRGRAVLPEVSHRREFTDCRCTALLSSPAPPLQSCNHTSLADIAEAQRSGLGFQCWERSFNFQLHERYQTRSPGKHFIDYRCAQTRSSIDLRIRPH